MTSENFEKYAHAIWTTNDALRKHDVEMKNNVQATNILCSASRSTTLDWIECNQLEVTWKTWLK